MNADSSSMGHNGSRTADVSDEAYQKGTRASRASSTRCEEKEEVEQETNPNPSFITGSDILNDVQPLPEPATKTAEAQPGAYSRAAGRPSSLLSKLRFSLVGLVGTVTASLRQSSGVEQGEPQPIALAGKDCADAGPGLAEAVPIQDEPQLKIKAQPFDLEADARKKARWERNRRIFICTLVFLLLLGVAISSALIFGNDDDALETIDPSMAPSASPSIAPTSYFELMISDLPNSTMDQLQIISSPQYQALEWVADHPDLQNMTIRRREQLFALATFYYAMEGPHWPEDIRGDWMVYDKSECYWFSSSFGVFDQDGKYHEEMLGVNPCNEDGVFAHLILSGLQLSGYNVSIPPELALLDALEALLLVDCGIQSSFSEFIPLDIYQKGALVYLYLRDNALTGTIPTEMVLLTNLKRLALWDNKLFGTLPTELGLLQTTDELMLSGNKLSGSIPSQLGLMTSLITLLLQRNALSGPIPSEIGLLEYSINVSLFENFLTGWLPSQMGLLTRLFGLSAYDNYLTGAIPSDMAAMRSMVALTLHGNRLTGTVPHEIGHLVVNGSLEALALEFNDLMGAIPSELCALGEFNWSEFKGLSFDCKYNQCGCNWCPCEGG